MNVIVLLADGARPDTIAAGMASGAYPALARLSAEGGMHEITTAFPSVTGPAYAPILTGRFPGPIGLPGLRWFDRGRTACRFPDYTRSYIGYQLAMIDDDLDAATPTVFELVPGSVGALSMITRGLDRRHRLGSLSLRSALRAAVIHFRGIARAWLDVDREFSREIVARAGTTPYLFAALTATDKLSHAEGHNSPSVVEALGIVDDTVRRLRETLERQGRWADTYLWITSDHGHSPVTRHDDLERAVQAMGFRVTAHPWVYRVRPEVGVMVSGNAMAHLYVDMARRARPYLGGMSAKSRTLVERMLVRSSVDLVMAPESDTACVVMAAGRGSATVIRAAGRYSYRRRDGDPLGLGRDLVEACAGAAYDACRLTSYPDGVVQIADLALAPRSGDIILSAALNWDLRARYEPIRHVSTHGALLRDQMLVPLIANHPAARPPRRTVDLMPSALTALGRPVPAGLDGESFV